MKRRVAPGIAQSELDSAGPAAADMRDFHVWFGDAHILKGMNVAFQEYRINCIVGPSGSGKSYLFNKSGEGALRDSYRVL